LYADIMTCILRTVNLNCPQNLRRTLLLFSASVTLKEDRLLHRRRLEPPNIGITFPILSLGAVDAAESFAVAGGGVGVFTGGGSFQSIATA
jgi:hypothetical protein